MSAELPAHTVRAYEGELGRLRELIARMGRAAGRQVTEAVDALIRRDAERATEVARRDVELDELEREADAFCIRLPALRQPMAADLRLTAATLKISHDLERIGDYAANAAKQAVLLAPLPQLGSLNGFGRMAALVCGNLQGAVDALVHGDTARAASVWMAYAPVDEIYNSIFREMLTHMMEDPHNITAATHTAAPMKRPS